MKTVTVHLKLATLNCELLIDDIRQPGPLHFEITQAGDVTNAISPEGRVIYEPGPRRVTIWRDGQVVFTTMDPPATAEKKGKDLVFTWQVDD
jgi:hypothetical protein